MVEQSLSSAWINNHVASTGKQPTVIVGQIRNLSHEHISTGTFVSDIQRELINSGKVEFVADSTQRQEIRNERKDQDLNAREDTRSEAGQEIGADYMMKGQINTILDVEGKNQVRFYQVDLNLISLKDNRVVWVGQEKIKKLVSNAKIRY